MKPFIQTLIFKLRETLQRNDRNTIKRCEVCSKLTMKTLERRHSDVFIVNFEHI